MSLQLFGLQRERVPEKGVSEKTGLMPISSRL